LQPLLNAPSEFILPLRRDERVFASGLEVAVTSYLGRLNRPPTGLLTPGRVGGVPQSILRSG